mgnify:CR=1 FL=1
MENMTMEKVANLCKQYGFVYQGSDIYGGLANTWDYGQLGSRVINSIKDAWRKRFVQERKNSYEIDCGILMNPKVWEASGHAKNFNDPQLDCKECKKRYRADKLINDYTSEVNPDLMSDEEMEKYIKENISCPNCGKKNYTSIKKFDLMFKTYRGTVDEEKMEIFLRPETCQGEYINFQNVLRTSRSKLPMTIGQIGKSFRNEVTPGNFLFRTIEFEQMELQTFCKPGDDEEIYNFNKKESMKFLTDLGIKEDNLRFKDHDKLVFYASAATDIQYNFPTGWDELWGIHNRTNYDLTQHKNYSGVDLDYLDPETNERYTPYILETAMGVGRLFLTIMCDAYNEETLEDVSGKSAIGEKSEDKSAWKNNFEVNPTVTDYGERQAEIVDFAIIDQYGAYSSIIEKGSVYKVKAKIHFHETVKNPIFTITIKNKQGTDITGTNTMFERIETGTVNAGEERIVTYEQQMNLQGGDYLLSLGCTGYVGDNFVVYHRLYDLVSFNVLSDKNTVGFFDMNSNITVENV